MNYKFIIKMKSIPQWVYYVWLIAIASLALSITAFFICVFPFVTWNVETVSIGIVLGFVGILATFIVVSNYAQVKDIERKFDKKIKEVDKRIEKLDENKCDNFDIIDGNGQSQDKNHS